MEANQNGSISIRRKEYVAIITTPPAVKMLSLFAMLSFIPFPASFMRVMNSFFSPMPPFMQLKQRIRLQMNRRTPRIVGKNPGEILKLVIK